MGPPVQIQLSDKQLAMLDRMVADGVVNNRSEVIHLALASLDEAVRRAGIGETVARSYRALPQSDEDAAVALVNAISMTEAEPW